jgi:cation diffusion facilitator CzcD-associated flavoprotein CzcO
MAEDFDVLIVGAGISGISAAWHLRHHRPGTRFAMLEREDGFGGTWYTHRFPGIRSDSDLYTFGFHFKPWEGPPIATAAEIQAYLGAVIEENQLGPHIRYRQAVETADWDSAAQRWRLGVRQADGSLQSLSCRFLWMAQGYYHHRKGYWPQWEGMESFQGTITHTEEWDEGLDYAGKRVALIGSGATAATVVPAMAGTAAHVTMVQRSPTWFFPAPNVNEMAELLRPLDLPPEWVHEIVRRKRNFDQAETTRRCREETEAVKAELLGAVQALLPEGYDMRHFTPSYDPWRQRLAFVPDGDLFAGIREGKASVVTGEIARFTPDGIAMADGAHVPADLIVLATGFDLCVLGDIRFSRDGKAIDPADTVTYRGMMFTGMPNLVWVFGYFRASWTLRSDLVSQFVCRLLDHMDATGATSVEPQLRAEDAGMPLQPFFDLADFNPHYIQRSLHLLPKSGPKPEWRHTQDYWTEKTALPAIDLDGAEFAYVRPATALAAE